MATFHAEVKPVDPLSVVNTSAYDARGIILVLRSLQGRFIQPDPAGKNHLVS